MFQQISRCTRLRKFRGRYDEVLRTEFDHF